MKKIAFLAIASYLLVACDATPGGNKGVLPVVHEEPIAPMPEETTLSEQVEDVKIDTTNNETATEEVLVVEEEVVGQ